MCQVKFRVYTLLCKYFSHIGFSSEFSKDQDLPANQKFRATLDMQYTAAPLLHSRTTTGNSLSMNKNVHRQVYWIEEALLMCFTVCEGVAKV